MPDPWQGSFGMDLARILQGSCKDLFAWISPPTRDSPPHPGRPGRHSNEYLGGASSAHLFVKSMSTELDGAYLANMYARCRPTVGPSLPGGAAPGALRRGWLICGPLPHRPPTGEPTCHVFAEKELTAPAGGFLVNTYPGNHGIPAEVRFKKRSLRRLSRQGPCPQVSISPLFAKL